MRNHYLDPLLGMGIMIGFILGAIFSDSSTGTLLLIGLSAGIGYMIAKASTHSDNNA